MNDTNDSENKETTVPNNEVIEPEVVMAPSSESVEETKAIQPTIVGIDDDIKSLLLQAVDITQDGVIHEPTCAICSSSVRSEAEQKWLETQDVNEVKQVLKSHEGSQVNASAIRHHMAFHLNREGGELQKMEYANRIQRMSNSYLSVLDRLNMGIAVLDDRLMSINALSPSKDFSQAEIEKLQGDLTVKLMGRMESLLKLKSTIEENMHKRGDVVTIPKSKFIEVFSTAIAEAKNEDVKKAIAEIVDTLRQLGQ